MTTYTQLARLPQIVPFDPTVRSAWGPLINSAWNAIEQLAAGNGTIDLTGLTSYSVTVANDATDQARQALLAFVGSPGGTCTVTVPPISRIGWVSNGTSNIIILTAGGVTLSIPAGMCVLYSVTGNAVSAVPVGFPVSLVAGALTANSAVIHGQLQLAAPGSTNNQFNFAQFNTATGYTQIAGAGGRDTAGLGLQIVTAAGVVQATFPLAGAVVFAETVNAVSFVTTSDRRAKTEITDITVADANAWVRNGRPRVYIMDGREHAGFIAQEDMNRGRGAAVHQVPDADPRYATSDGYSWDGERLARDYNQDIAYLTKALATALDRIDALEAARGV